MKRAILPLIAIGVAGVVLLAIEAAIAPRRAALAYTAAFTFGITTALGSLIFVMINHTARSTWYVVFRRLNEAIADTVPLFALLFVPIAVAFRGIFPWAHPGDFGARAELSYRHAHVWYQPGFFMVRSYAYLAVWTAIAFVLRRESLRQDEDGRVAHTNVQRWVSSAATPVIAITLTLAGIDWVMTLVPGWFSTMQGLYVFAAGFSGAVGLTCVAAWLARRSGMLPGEVGPSHFLAIGRVLLVTTILWAYIAFCNFLLVWIADLPHEVVFYAQRVAGAWAIVSAVLLFGHFVIPFLALLSRALKLRPPLLATVGGWMLALHAVDAYWLVMPSQGDPPSVLDAGAFLAVFGFAAAFAVWRYFAVRAVPIRDPNLAPALAYVSH